MTCRYHTLQIYSYTGGLCFHTVAGLTFINKIKCSQHDVMYTEARMQNMIVNTALYARHWYVVTQKMSWLLKVTQNLLKCISLKKARFKAINFSKSSLNGSHDSIFNNVQVILHFAMKNHFNIPIHLPYILYCFKKIFIKLLLFICKLNTTYHSYYWLSLISAEMWGKKFLT